MCKSELDFEFSVTDILPVTDILIDELSGDERRALRERTAETDEDLDGDGRWFLPFFALAGVLLFGSTPCWAELPKVSVVSFENKVANSENGQDCRNWNWFTGSLGGAFRERLVSELLKSGKVSVLEREFVREVYEDEHALVNSEGQRRLKRGQFQVADFTLAGAVTELEWCSTGGDGGIVLAGLFGHEVGFGVKSSKASVAVDVRVIQTTSAEVVESVQGRGNAISSKVSFNLANDHLKVGTSGFNNSPLGEAIDSAIREAAAKILAHL